MALPADLSAPSTVYSVKTASATPFTEGVARALLVSAASTATLVRQDGTTVTGVPLQQGYNPLMCTAITAASGSPTIVAVF